MGELPAHNHSASTNTTGNHNHGFQMYTYNGSTNDNYPSSFDTNRPGIYKYTDNNGNHSHTVNINNTGSNQAHNNIQPYISCYIWKRVS